MSTGDKIQTAIVIANFGTLLVLLYSIRVATNASFATVYQGLAGQMHEIDKFFVEHPELRRHFYSTQPLPDDEVERDRLKATAEMIVDFADNFAAQCRSLPKRYEYGWAEYFQTLYTKSVPIQDYWRENGVWYREDLRSIFDAAARSLAAGAE